MIRKYLSKYVYVTLHKKRMYVSFSASFDWKQHNATIELANINEKKSRF